MSREDDAPAAIIAIRRPYRELSDGTLRVQLDIEPADKVNFLRMFPGAGDAVVLAKITDAAQREALMAAATKPDFGDDARILRQSAFFRTPEVWRALGTDDDFRRWCWTQPCAFDTSTMDPLDRKHEGDVVFCHVLRIANGAGKGIKPQYSGIPGCHKHHQMQHQYGESVVGGKEYLDRQRIVHVQRWAWDTLKRRIGVESMKQADPARVLQWAEEHGVESNLPREYREAGR